MKQTTIKLIVLSFIISPSIYAQETTTKKHELSFDLLDLISFNKFNFSYDYILNKSSSIGSNISFAPNNEKLWRNQKFQENFTVGINYKYFFSKKFAQGFYLEAHTEYNFGKSFMKKNYDSNNFKEYNSLDIGSGIGYKHVFKNNIFIDANIKYTTNLLNSLDNNSAYYFPEIKAFVGFSIGKRF